MNSLLQGHDPEIFPHLIKERKPISNKIENQVSNDANSPEYLTTRANRCEPEPTLNTTNPEKITYQESSLQFTIWGGVEKDNIHRLKINLLVQLSNDDFKYYQDDVNLYSNGQLQRYIRGASEELECSTTLLKNHHPKTANPP